MAGRGKSTYGRLKTDAERTAFLNYIKGDKNIEQLTAHKTPKEDLKIVKVGIVPFGQAGALTALDADAKVPVSMTVQAWKIHALLTEKFKAILNLGITATQIGGDPIVGFQPARAIVRLSSKADLAADTKRTSAMTSRKYKQVKTRSGSIPFGRSTDTKVRETDAPAETPPTAVGSDYNEVLKALAANAGLEAENSTWQFSGISFTPEKFPNPSSAAVTYPSTSPGDLG